MTSTWNLFAGRLVLVLALAASGCADQPPRGAAAASSGGVAPAEAAVPGAEGLGDITVEVGRHTQVVTGISGDAAGRWVATVSLDKTLRIWGLPSRELVRTIRPPDGPGTAGALRTVAMSPDGERIAVSGATLIQNLGFAIFIFERRSGRMLHRIDGAPHRVAQLSWSPDGRLLAAALAGPTGLQLHRMSDYAPVGSEAGFAKGVVSVDFDAKGRLGVLTGDDELRLYATTGDRLQPVASASTRPARGALRMRFSPDGAQIAATFKDSAEVIVYGAANLERVRKIAMPNNGSRPSGPVEWEADSMRIVAALSSGKPLLGRWPGQGETLGGKGRVEWQWLRESDRQTQPIGAAIDLQRSPSGLLLATTLPGWTLVPAGGFVASEVEQATIPRAGAGFSADGRQLLIELVSSHLGSNGMEDSRLGRFSLADLSLRPPTGMDRGFRPGNHAAVLAAGDSGLRRMLEADREAWRIDLPGRVVAYHVGNDYRFMVVQVEDGSFHWYRYDDGRPMFSLFVHPDGVRWAMWTAEGAYTASPGGEALLGRRVAHGLDAAAEFIALDRGGGRRDPGAVVAAVAAALVAPTPAAVRTTADSAGPNSAPVLRLLAPASGARVDPPFATLRFVVDAAGRAARAEPFTHIKVAVDDRSPFLVDRAQLRAVPGTAAYDLDVRIEAKEMRIQLRAVDAGRESAPVRLSLTSTSRTVEADGSFWAEASLWNPGLRQLESCWALTDLRDSMGAFQAQLGRLLTDADRQLVATGRPGATLSSAVEVRRVMELEAIDTMLLALNSQWAGAEEFVRTRQARRLPPIGREDSDYIAEPTRKAIALREQALTVLLEAAAARGQLPEARFEDVIRNGGPVLLDAALALTTPPESALRGSYARSGGATTIQLASAMKAARTDRSVQAGVAVRKAAWATRKQLADAFSGRVCEPQSRLSAATGPAELSTKPQDLAEQLTTMRHALRTLVQAATAGTLLEILGQLDEAYALLEPTYAIALASLGPGHPLTLETRAALARVQGRRNRLAEAQALWAGWVQASQRALSEELWMVDEAARREVLRNNRRNVDGFLSALVRWAPGDAAAQALALSTARKGLLTRVATELNGLARSSRDPATRELIARVEKQRREVAGLLFRPGADAEAVKRERARLTELEGELATKVRARRSGASLPGVAELRQALAGDEALVDFQVYRDPAGADGERSAPRLVAVVLRKAGEPVLLQWPELAGIGSAIAAYRELIDPDSAPAVVRTSRLRAAAATLTRLLWAPVEAQLGGIRRVNLVPDGALSLVPFHALPVGDSGYLASRYELTVLASPRDLVLQPVAGSARRALIVGAPDYGPAGPSGGGGSRTIVPALQDLVFEPLPGALEESRKVAAIVRGAYSVELLTGERASETALYKTARTTVLHLATHGFFLQDMTEAEAGDDPMQVLTRAGVSLAHANSAARGGARGGEDGILTALEATTLDLRGTRLVVLSACDTGLGQIEAGEGMHGLVRAFGEAGAQAVLATLWPVDDEATREFMLGFYRRFVAGESPRAALRAMQLEFMRSREWNDPHYWAPFVLVGR